MRRGFTLIEMMIVVAIVGVMAGLSAWMMSSATRAVRLSGSRYNFINTLGMAKQRALARGTDVYVILLDLDSTAASPANTAARVVVYEDRTLAIRSATTLPDLETLVAANPTNVVDEINAGGGTFGESGLAFVDTATPATSISACDLSKIPPYITVSAARRTTQACRAWCTFCTTAASGCSGAIRFSPDGLARIVTGVAGSGGLVKLVNPSDRTKAACIAIAEPNGIALTLNF